MDLEPSFAGRGTISQKSPWEIAFEIAAAPDADLPDMGIFQGAIDPGAA